MTLYTTPVCPKCKVIKMKMSKLGIDYDVCEDEDKMQSKGILSVPVLELDNDPHLLNFEEILQFIKNYHQEVKK